MNKNNYCCSLRYYRQKLAQAMLFEQERNWLEIPDLTDPNDDIYNVAFLSSLLDLLKYYSDLDCLDEYDTKRAYEIIGYLRYSISYRTRSEKQYFYSYYNNMIRMVNKMTGMGTKTFYCNEIEKRYGYFNGKQKNFLSAFYFTNGYYRDKSEVKFDLAQDIYPLILLFSSFERLPLKTQNVFIANNYILGTLNALEKESKVILEDDFTRNQFLQLLEKNKEVLKNPSCFGDKDDYDIGIRMQIQNHLLIKRLRQYSKK